MILCVLDQLSQLHSYFYAPTKTIYGFSTIPCLLLTLLYSIHTANHSLESISNRYMQLSRWSQTASDSSTIQVGGRGGGGICGTSPRKSQRDLTDYETKVGIVDCRCIEAEHSMRNVAYDLISSYAPISPEKIKAKDKEPLQYSRLRKFLSIF